MMASICVTNNGMKGYKPKRVTVSMINLPRLLAVGQICIRKDSVRRDTPSPFRYYQKDSGLSP